MKDDNIIYLDEHREGKFNRYPLLESSLERLERLIEENQKKSDEVLRGAIELMTKIIEVLRRYDETDI